jgi:two-component system NarL family response regulator
LSEEKRVRLLIVEDHHVVRKGLVALLSAASEVEVVGEASDGAEAVACFGALQPDVTLMDLRMPNMGGVEAITRIRQDFPAARFIVLTTFDGDEDIYRSLQAGAKAYLRKGWRARAVSRQAVHSGRTHSASDCRKLAERMSWQELTARELRVPSALWRGREQEIAADLKISEQ